MTEPYYSDDLVTLYLGDCREVTEWLEADVLVTDPPYGRGWKQGDTNVARGWSHNGHAGIAGDADTGTRDAALAAWGARPAITFGDLMLAPPSGTKLAAVYYKASGTDGSRGAVAGVRRDAEAIYFIGSWPTGLGGRSSVFRTVEQVAGSSGLAAKCGHPHAKAPDVLAALIDLCPPGFIADPFAGSGSTLVAAKQLGRRSVGVELDERYCEIAAKRLAQQAFVFPPHADPAPVPLAMELDA